MTKREAVEKIERLEAKVRGGLEAYRAAAGPTSWGDSPSDPIAAYKVGVLAGLRQAREEVGGRRR